MRIRLTRKFNILTEQAKERVRKLRQDFIDSRQGSEPVDEEGHNAEWYERLAMPVPEDLKGNSFKMGDNPMDIMVGQFSEKDYRKVKSKISVEIGYTDYIEEHLEGGSILCFPSGRDLFVEESVKEIERLEEEARNKLNKENKQN